MRVTQRTYKHGDKLNFNEAAKLLTALAIQANENQRKVEERQRKRITCHAKNGKLPNENGKSFLIEEFVGWAKSLPGMGDGWEAKFKGLPSVRRFAFDIDSPAPTVETSIVTIPETPEKASELIRQLQAKLDACEEENAKFRLAEEARKHISQTNSNSAKKPRNL